MDLFTSRVKYSLPEIGLTRARFVSVNRLRECSIPFPPLTKPRFSLLSCAVLFVFSKSKPFLFLQSHALNHSTFFEIDQLNKFLNISFLHPFTNPTILH